VLEHKSGYISETRQEIEEKLQRRTYRNSPTLFWFFGLRPYFYFRFRLWSHRDGRFGFIFCPYSPAIGTRWYRWTY